MPIRALRVWVVLLLPAVIGAPSAAADRQPTDRVLAVVDADPILASEVQQILAFGVIEAREGEDERALQRRALDFLIAQRLRFHEVDRFGFGEVPLDVVDEQLRAIRARFDSEESFQQHLDELGLDEPGARQVLARQIMVWVYVEERLGARVFVGLEDIQTYYDEVFVPQQIERGESVPPLPEVREPIRALLREERINEELERWTSELLQGADVDDYFESRYQSLPPVVFAADVP